MIQAVTAHLEDNRAYAFNTHFLKQSLKVQTYLATDPKNTEKNYF